ISQDTNGNGIPDECEQQAAGGGSPSTPGGNGTAVASPEALAAFTDWCLQQRGDPTPRSAAPGSFSGVSTSWPNSVCRRPTRGDEGVSGSR
ncbi:MAG: hypothetical protein ACE5F9_11820, partial [Phycisphaerae bacterium]